MEIKKILEKSKKNKAINNIFSQQDFDFNLNHFSRTMESGLTKSIISALILFLSLLISTLIEKCRILLSEKIIAGDINKLQILNENYKNEITAKKAELNEVKRNLLSVLQNKDLEFKKLEDKLNFRNSEIELLKSKTNESNDEELFKKLYKKNNELESLEKRHNELENKHQQLKLKQLSSLEIGKDDKNRYYFILNLPEKGVFNLKYFKNAPENLYKFLFTYAIAKLFDMRVEMPNNNDVHNYSHSEFNGIIITNLNKKISGDNKINATKIEKEDLLINISSVKRKYHWVLKINEIQIKNFHKIKNKNKNLYDYLNSHFKENLFEN